MSFLFAFWTIFSSTAHANFQMDFMKAKASAKSATRWTLSDWLAQKNKSRLADQWLAANRAADTAFELNLGGGLEVFGDRQAQIYQLDTYISFFNLFGEYEKTDDDKETFAGGAGFRLLGASSQTTNLIARYGLREWRNSSTKEISKNDFLEGQLQLYVFDFFGLLSCYRYLFPHASSQNNRMAGYRVTAGAFLEFGMLRLYANYFREPNESSDSNGAVTKTQNEGVEYGLKLFF